MAKNRKTQSAAIRFGPALKAFLLCLLIGGSGIGYVWQKEQIDRLGKQISRRERELAQVEEQNEKLRKQLGTMRSPRFLEMRIKELKLGLVAPQQTQVWWLVESPADAPRAPLPEGQLAARAVETPVLP
jgi:hypothetical protein